MFTLPPVLNSSYVGIHGNSTFINFEFSFYTLPMLFLLVPILYIPITIIIILRILVKLYYAFRDRNNNVYLLSAISISQCMCLLFFLADFLYLRLPTSGLLTSWCASIEPNRFITILTIFTYHINYSTMIFPFLVSIMRLILIISPKNHKKFNGQLLRFSIPFICVYPIIFTFFMFPAIGYCSYAAYPFPFGAIIFRIERTFFGLVNNFSLLFNTLFWMTCCIITNFILLLLLIKSRCLLNAQTRSMHSYKVEVSLSLTTFSMIFSYLSNAMIVFLLLELHIVGHYASPIW
ncbi:Serpentine receptor class U-26 [Caenorhabditis elegans]|uniref:Serpentine receptor class U-26 n=1 Tax=Caenorhabditis elegans TaxID=6239 RepID=SRU26_CAEEL|nr:Serpentine receptor class U-26 [Caenorhabditis elegans]P83502.2 RecName: Full=Serpentine receptor class U-26; Short=Protein sru-26 [Caenorhabditis elegans]CAD45601.2 Serpentine receptor class U-26 [Caenorhabditis elegans]|eukprot:NP_741493.2 Serpentine receptor class U-26 [Caenorhabditis elegans]